MAVSKAEILDAIAGMTVLELSELIKEMEEKFGVSAAAAAVAVAAPAAAAPKPAVAPKPAAWASRKPRIWLMARQSPSRKPFPRLMPKPSRSSSRTPAPRSRSSKRKTIAGWRSCRQPAFVLAETELLLSSRNRCGSQTRVLNQFPPALSFDLDV